MDIDVFIRFEFEEIAIKFCSQRPTWFVHYFCKIPN